MKNMILIDETKLTYGTLSMIAQDMGYNIDIENIEGEIKKFLEIIKISENELKNSI